MEKLPVPLPLVSINPHKKPLTPDIFRNFTGQQDLSDEEANSRIETTQRFVSILLEFSRIGNHCIDRQLVVYLEEGEIADPTIKKIPPLTKTKSA